MIPEHVTFDTRNMLQPVLSWGPISTQILSSNQVLPTKTSKHQSPFILLVGTQEVYFKKHVLLRQCNQVWRD